MRLALISLLLFSPIATAEIPDAPVAIKSIHLNGSGCSLGTATADVSPDASRIGFHFEDMIAEIGPDLDLSASRRNCVITLVIAAPQGWQYAVGRHRVSGYAALDDAVKGFLSTSIFFEGQGQTQKLSSSLLGPTDQDYVFENDPSLTGLWSSCTAERALNLNFSVQVTNLKPKEIPNARGFMILDNISKLDLVWRKCR